MTYQITLNPFGEPCAIKRLTDNAFIPPDFANTDYQEFLRWCDEGNEPLPADEPAPAES